MIVFVCRGARLDGREDAKKKGAVRMNEENNNEFENGNSGGYNPFSDSGNGGGGNSGGYNSFSNFTKPKTRGWSVVSLVVGIISVLCCCLGWAGLVFGAVAVIASIISRRSLGYFDGLAIAGLVLGIFGIVFGGAILITSYTQADFWNEFWEEYFKEFEDLYPDISNPSGDI